MEGISKVMTGITLLTIIILSYTTFINSQNSESLDPNKEYIDTFLFETPLQKVSINYENPEKGDLLVQVEENYKGTKISLGEYKFELRGNVSNVTYYFEFPEKLVKENDVNPETIELYTVLDGEIVKAGGEKGNQSIVLTTNKLIPILVLAEPNEAIRVSEEELYYNSRSKSAIYYEKIINFFSKPLNTMIFFVAIAGLIMTAILVAIEQSRKPEDDSSKKTIHEYIEHVRSEGLSDEEIIAELVERGIKSTQATVLVKRRK